MPRWVEGILFIELWLQCASVCMCVYLSSCNIQDSGLITSVGRTKTQSPEFKPRHVLATFLWKNRQVAKDHPHAAITLSSMGLQTYMQ